MIEETQTAFDIENLISVFPIWDDNVWSPLQSKRFAEAQRNLELILNGFEPDEWSSVYWTGLFQGAPALQGDLNQEEWNQQVKPLLVKAILNSATGAILSGLYQNLSFDEKIELTRLVFDNLPGKNGNEKIGWLKENKSSIFVLFTASPAQNLGINPGFDPGLETAKRTAAKYEAAPKLLQDAIYSFAVAETLFRIGQTNHLSTEKTSLLAAICGQLILGLMHFEDLSNQIQNKLSVDKRLGDELAADIQNKIIIGLEDDIREVYEPITDIIEKERSASSIDLETFDAERPKEREIKIQTESPIGRLENLKTGEPLIISREEILTEEKKPSIRGFSFPGFFKTKKTEPESQPAVKVKIETPAQSPNKEKRVVHYSEFRTPITPFNESNEFISLENFSKKTAEPIKIAPPIAKEGVGPERSGQKPTLEPIVPKPEVIPVAEQAPMPKETNPETPTEKKPAKNFLWFGKQKNAGGQSPNPTLKPAENPKSQPSIEGNIIDLR